MRDMKLYRKAFKRFLDFLLSFTTLILLSPMLIVVTVWLYKIFKVIKFKSMTDERDATGKLLPNEKRITTIGKIIRKTSIDELPQLWNVLKGEMSLIGPRPLLPRYLSLYTPEQARRHEVRPGITGWAQVNGRNNITWTEKFKLDTWYVDNCSFLLDVKIILLTVKNVLSAKDIQISTGGFTGNN